MNGYRQRTDRRRRAARLFVGLLALGLVLPAAAAAAIVVDPDAPAGVQYSAPLDRARAEGGSGGTAGAPGSSEQAPPFGEGVERESSSSASTGSGGSTESDVATPSLMSGDGSGGALRVVAACLAVVAVGGALALFLRRNPLTRSS